MGMYTELIFGATLKKDTPENVIQAIKYMLGELKERPEAFPFEKGRLDHLLQLGSYYFAINNSVCKFWLDDISKCWILSARCNLKNYEGEIEEFLEWIKPYIESGSGEREMYAITLYEESSEPTIYYLRN